MNNLDTTSLSCENVIPVFDAIILKSKLKESSLKLLKMKEDQGSLTFECRQTLWIVKETYCASYSIANLEKKIEPLLAIKSFSMKEKEEASEFLRMPRRFFEEKDWYFCWYDGKQMLPHQATEIFKLWKTTLPTT